jgi:hypothetical protein
VVTDRGRAVATINPTDAGGASEADGWAHGLVATGRASWGGGKPRNFADITLAGGATMAETVLDDRR